MLRPESVTGGESMGNIKDEIDAFQRLQPTLEASYMGLWVVIHDQKLVRAFASFEDAAAEAVRLFGGGPFLIRQVGAPPMALPASVMYHRVNADH